MGSQEKVETIESREWYLAAHAPEGVPTSDHLKLRTFSISLADESIHENHVVVKILYISVDPYLRAIMTGIDDGLCLPQFQINQVIFSYGIGRVIRSKESNYSGGDFVPSPVMPVAEYSMVQPSQLRFKNIDPGPGIPFTDYLSTLGVAGYAAWVALKMIGNPKPGSNVFISAAAGGVGMHAGQLAKLKGCNVIGSTGTDEKVELLKEIGYDDAFNYNASESFDAALSKYCPDGIDFYLDNVGGKMLEAVLNHVNHKAHIVLCGMISQYNKVWKERDGIRNLLNMVGKEVKMEGYLMSSLDHRFGDFTKEMETYIKQGKIISKHVIYNGIESFLESLGSMFSSSNIGKVLIQSRNKI
ncbi:2-alkenal reductase (NADP(+)-dependent)-like [Mangifera indica]|uniref:2-alkenal reductase (NADP(+)-dependent)-like n=1 Tax=Mangifera indica TaxID=29780 RepID=UPI001CF9B0D3|nr:2-alkenal reductase (NADP(+)-dependent)-like [Mangifera indica]